MRKNFRYWFVFADYLVLAGLLLLLSYLLFIKIALVFHILGIISFLIILAAFLFYLLKGKKEEKKLVRFVKKLPPSAAVAQSAIKKYYFCYWGMHLSMIFILISLSLLCHVSLFFIIPILIIMYFQYDSFGFLLTTVDKSILSLSDYPQLQTIIKNIREKLGLKKYYLGKVITENEINLLITDNGDRHVNIGVYLLHYLKKDELEALIIETLLFNKYCSQKLVFNLITHHRHKFWHKYILNVADHIAGNIISEYYNVVIEDAHKSALEFLKKEKSVSSFIHARAKMRLFDLHQNYPPFINIYSYPQYPQDHHEVVLDQFYSNYNKNSKTWLEIIKNEIDTSILSPSYLLKEYEVELNIEFKEEDYTREVELIVTYAGVKTNIIKPIWDQLHNRRFAYPNSLIKNYQTTPSGFDPVKVANAYFELCDYEQGFKLLDYEIDNNKNIDAFELKGYQLAKFYDEEGIKYIKEAGKRQPINKETALAYLHLVAYSGNKEQLQKAIEWCESRIKE